MSAAPSFATSSLLVALGGALGAWSRHVVGFLALLILGPLRAGAFPWATLTCNVLGSLAMGLLAGWLARHGTGGETWRLLLGVGILGGFTTFSAFSLDAMSLWMRGQAGQAALYVALSVVLSLAAAFAGMWLSR